MAAPRLVYADRVSLGVLPSAPSDAPVERPWLPWLGAAYLGMGVIGAGACYATGRSPWSQQPWLPTFGLEAVVVSVILGAASGALVVIASRSLEKNATWARALGDKLRPLVRHQSAAALAAMAVAAGVCEEVFFRGWLAQVAGVAISSLAFGLPHQVKGAGRIGWIVSAIALGAWMATLYRMTGQLIGPIIAHTLINAVNLFHLRRTARLQRSSKLGGLLAPARRG